MQTLFDIDMKQATKNPNFKPGAIYDLMTARKDAHFFDFSQDVSETLVETFLSYKDFEDIPFVKPPVGKALLRFKFKNTKMFFNSENYDRLNSAMVIGTKFYFIQETTDGQMRLYPFVLDSDISGTENTPSASFYKGEKISREQIEQFEDGNKYKISVIGMNTPVQDFEVDARAVFGFTALCHLAFAMLYETKAMTVEREQIEQGWSTQKNRAFYTKTTIVKIAMSRVRNKYLKRSEPTGRKMPWGEVRSHFAHWRVTDPNCQHQWQDRTGEGRKFKCDKCGEIKTLRTFPEGRGNKEIGIIKTNYEVSST
jgi:hypothetical protein